MFCGECHRQIDAIFSRRIKTWNVVSTRRNQYASGKLKELITCKHGALLYQSTTHRFWCLRSHHWLVPIMLIFQSLAVFPERFQSKASLLCSSFFCGLPLNILLDVFPGCTSLIQPACSRSRPATSLTSLLTCLNTFLLRSPPSSVSSLCFILSHLRPSLHHFLPPAES